VRRRRRSREARLAPLSRVIFRLVLAYDGTDFQGWQAQPGRRPARTVQGELEAAPAPLAGGARVPVEGAGRTDAGVHALGQVASFALQREIGARELMRALNALLPADVRVLEAAIALPGFHARRSALAKRYRYELDTGPVQLPTRRRTAGHVPFLLDAAALAAAAALYLGRHDFAALQSSGGSVKTTLRTVLRSEARLLGATLVYETEADGYLRKMVRSMVGGLIAVGRGALSVEQLARALEGRERAAWPAPAQARGLSLVGVSYPGPGADAKIRS
jgi:tRNA pseudouridine38-40 synthase